MQGSCHLEKHKWALVRVLCKWATLIIHTHASKLSLGKNNWTLLRVALLCKWDKMIIHM
jgi:hypothetical protein